MTVPFHGKACTANTPWYSSIMWTQLTISRPSTHIQLLCKVFNGVQIGHHQFSNLVLIFMSNFRFPTFPQTCHNGLVVLAAVSAVFEHFQTPVRHFYLSFAHFYYNLLMSKLQSWYQWIQEGLLVIGSTNTTLSITNKGDLLKKKIDRGVSVKASMVSKALAHLQFMIKKQKNNVTISIPENSLFGILLNQWCQISDGQLAVEWLYDLYDNICMKLCNSADKTLKMLHQAIGKHSLG